MPEKPGFVPEQERVGVPEDDFTVLEIIPAAEVSSRISQAELGQLISLNDKIFNSGLPEDQLTDRVRELDEISLEVTGHEVSTFRYYFPDELPAFVKKRDYREVGRLDLNHRGTIKGFKLLPSNQILLQLPNDVILTDIENLSHNYTDQEEGKRYLSGKRNDICILPGGPFAATATPDKQGLFFFNEGKRKCLAEDVERFQFIGKGRVVVKRKDCISLVQFDDNSTSERQMLEMPREDCQIKVFSDGTMLVYGGDDSKAIKTFRIDQSGDATQLSQRDVADLLPDLEKYPLLQLKFISSTEIATQIKNRIYYHRLTKKGWEAELVYEDTSNTPNPKFKVLPNGDFLILTREDLVRCKMGKKGRLFSGVYDHAIGEDPLDLQVSYDGKIFILYQTNSGYHIKILDGMSVEKEENA